MIYLTIFSLLDIRVFWTFHYANKRFLFTLSFKKPKSTFTVLDIHWQRLSGYSATRHTHKPAGLVAPQRYVVAFSSLLAYKRKKKWHLALVCISLPSGKDTHYVHLC